MSIQVITAQANRQPLAKASVDIGCNDLDIKGNGILADLSCFRALQAAALTMPDLIILVVPGEDLLAPGAATSRLTALGLMRVAALELATQNVRCHAISCGDPKDQAIVEDLVHALAANHSLPSGQVFACANGHLEILSQPRPVRVSSRTTGDWSFDEIDTVARDFWHLASMPSEAHDKPAGTLAGKVAIVTGGGGGIGRAICHGFARMGARVVVNDIGAVMSGETSGEDPATLIAREIMEAGGQALADSGNVASEADNITLLQNTLSAFGRLDILVNSAGIIRMAPLAEMTEDEWSSVLDVNLYGPARLSHMCAEAMIRTGGGSFVHLTSASGLIGSIGQANYAASKLGLTGLSRELVAIWGEQGIRSNCLAPSSTSRMTEMTDNSRRAELGEAAFARLKQSRAASMPKRIVPLIAWLASDRAQDITGQVFGARASDMYLYNQHGPVRSLSLAEVGDNRQSCIAAWLDGAAQTAATPLEKITDVFDWSPVMPTVASEEKE